MAERTTKVALRIENVVSGLNNLVQMVDSLENLDDETRQFASQAKNLVQELSSLRQQQGLIEQFRALKKETQDTGRALAASREETAKYGRAVSQSRTALQGIAEQQTTIAGSVRKLEAGLRTSKAELQQYTAELRNSDQVTSSQAQRYFELTREVEKNEKALRDARTEQKQVVASNKEATREYDKQQKALNRSAAATKKLAASERDQRLELQKIRTSLKAAGVDTNKFGAEQRRLESAVESTGRKLTGLKSKLERASAALKKQLPDPTTTAQKGISGLASKVLNLDRLIGALTVAAAVATLKRLATGALDAAKQIARLELSLDSVSGGNSAVLMAQLADEADRLGINIGQLSRPFSEFVASTRELNIEQSNQVRLFGLFTESLIRGGGTADEVADTILGLNQSIRQGNLQWDEFRQIASRLPGAFDAASKAFGVAREELKAFVSTGEASFDQRSLQVFVEELGRSVNATGEEMQLLTSEEGRLSNSLLRAGSAFAEASGLATAYRAVLRTVSGVANSVSESLTRSRLTGAEAAAVLAADFDGARAALKAAREEAAGLGDNLAKTGAAARDQRIDEITAELDGLVREYDKLGKTGPNAFRATLSAGSNAKIAAAEVKLEIADLRSELNSLEAVRALDNLVDADSAEAATAAINGVVSTLQRLPEQGRAASETMGELQARIGGLSDETLAALQAQLKQTQAGLLATGADVGNVNRALQLLAEEGARRVEVELGKFAAAQKGASEAIKESFDGLERQASQMDRVASTAATLQGINVTLARAALTDATAQAKLTGSLIDQLRVRRLKIELAQQEAVLARAVANQASAEARESVRLVELKRSEINAQESVAAALEKRIAATGKESAASRERRTEIQKVIETLKAEASQLESNAEVKAAQANAQTTQATLAEDAAERTKKSTQEATEETKKQATAQRDVTTATEETSEAVSSSIDLVKLMADALAGARDWMQELGDENLLEAFNARLADILRQTGNLAGGSLVAAPVAAGVDAAIVEIDRLEAELSLLREEKFTLRPLGVTEFLNAVATAENETKIAFLKQEQYADNLQSRLDGLNLLQVQSAMATLRSEAGLLGDERLEELGQALEERRRQVLDFRDSMVDALSSTEERLARLLGNEVEAKRLNQARELAEAEDELAQAREIADTQAEAAAARRIMLLQQAHKLELDQVRAQQEQNAEREKANQLARETSSINANNNTQRTAAPSGGGGRELGRIKLDLGNQEIDIFADQAAAARLLNTVRNTQTSQAA